MCGIAGIMNTLGGAVPRLNRSLAVMSGLIAHRGPDGEGQWCSELGNVGLTHRRLSVIDLTESGRQPMAGPGGLVLVHNGEIYNYVELRDSLSSRWTFRSESDTETILAAYAVHGRDCLQDLRGMFAFALWDESRRALFCARDRFGIKPFYYTRIGDRLLFASEVKALLPFLPSIETNPDVLAEYLTLQFALGESTLFKDVKELLPGHALWVEDGQLTSWRYWDVDRGIDLDHTAGFFERGVRTLLDDSVAVHLRADVPVGSYLSGGLDSSLIALLANEKNQRPRDAFHGRFVDHPGYDESGFASEAAEAAGMNLHVTDITATQFRDRIPDVLYHLDYPVAGPGAFPQFMVSSLAAEKVKVVLAGQGGDEVFGGYARYLLAYLEQCLKAPIEGMPRDGRFVATAESIVPNLGVLKEYEPLMRRFWGEGLFDSLDRRYLRLVDRSIDLEEEVCWQELNRDAVYGAILERFNSSSERRNESYFDSMTRFDFTTLLPALLHVEDRVSMAHGIESRVPFLDHPLIEFVATIPADIKFKDGRLKHLLRECYPDVVPTRILERRDKMGFPVPLGEWAHGELRDYFHDLFGSTAAQTRPYVNGEVVRNSFATTNRSSRKLWGLLSLEIWYQQFHDRAASFRSLLEAPTPTVPVGGAK